MRLLSHLLLTDTWYVTAIYTIGIVAQMNRYQYYISSGVCTKQATRNIWKLINNSHGHFCCFPAMAPPMYCMISSSPAHSLFIRKGICCGRDLSALVIICLPSLLKLVSARPSTWHWMSGRAVLIYKQLSSFVVRKTCFQNNFIFPLLIIVLNNAKYWHSHGHVHWLEVNSHIHVYGKSIYLIACRSYAFSSHENETCCHAKTLQEVKFIIGFGTVLNIYITKLICHEPVLSIVGDRYLVGMW